MSTKDGDGEKQDDKSDYNPKLDFLSDQFDPLLALNTPSVVVPVPTAKTYDNIGVYQSAQIKPQLQERAAMKKRQAASGPSTSSGANIVQRRWLPHQMPIPSTRKEVNKNLYTRMAETQGPLDLLKKCVDERRKIKVYNRRGHELRGFCIGYITLFDKHWNMVLEDVYEEWERDRKRKMVFDFLYPDKSEYRPVNQTPEFKPVVPSPEIDVKRHAKVKGQKQRETCSRKVKQLVMRGEHVSHIYVLDDDEKS